MSRTELVGKPIDWKNGDIFDLKNNDSKVGTASYVYKNNELNFVATFEQEHSAFIMLFDGDTLRYLSDTKKGIAVKWNYPVTIGNIGYEIHFTPLPKRQSSSPPGVSPVHSDT